MKFKALIFGVLVFASLMLLYRPSTEEKGGEVEAPVEKKGPQVVEGLPLPEPVETPKIHPKPEEPWARAIAESKKQATAEDSMKVLAQALEENPQSSEILAEMGFVMLQGMQDPQKALEYFERSLEIQPDNSDAISALANIYVKEGLTYRGIEVLKNLMNRAPGNTTIPIALADCLAKQGKQAEGLELLEDSRRRAEKEDSFTPYLGMMYLNTGNPAKAVDVFKRILEKREREGQSNSNQVEWARLDLANAWMAQGNYVEAESMIQGVLERSPKDKFAVELLERLKKSRPSNSL